MFSFPFVLRASETPAPTPTPTPLTPEEAFDETVSKIEPTLGPFSGIVDPVAGVASIVVGLLTYALPVAIVVLFFVALLSGSSRRAKGAVIALFLCLIALVLLGSLTTVSTGIFSIIR